MSLKDNMFSFKNFLNKLEEDYKSAKAAFLNKGGEEKDVIQALKDFKDIRTRLQSTLSTDEKNVDWWAKNKTWEEFKNWVVQKKVEKTKSGLKKDSGTYMEVMETDKWKVIIPLDHESSCFFGKGTDWCTTKPSQPWFSRYFYMGKTRLVYFLNKSNPNEDKYAMAINTKYSHEDNANLTYVDFFNREDSAITSDVVKEKTSIDPKEILDFVYKNLSKIDQIANETKKTDISTLITTVKETGEENPVLANLIIATGNLELGIQYYIYALRAKHKFFIDFENYLLRKKNVEYLVKYITRIPREDLFNIKDHLFFKKAKEEIYLSKNNSYIMDFLRHATDNFRKNVGEQEKNILKSVPDLAYFYASDIGKRFPEGEPAILTSAEMAYSYAKYIIRGRWPEAEKIISSDIEYAYAYAREIIHGRFKEGEPEIIKKSIEKKDGSKLYYYCREVNKGRPIKEFGDALLKISSENENNKDEMVFLFYYALRIRKTRWKAVEHFLIKSTNPVFAYDYAKDILKGRWPEAEKAIIDDGTFIINYARDLIKGRWPEAEEKISKDGYESYFYATRILHGPFPAGEQAMKDIGYYEIYKDRLKEEKESSPE